MEEDYQEFLDAFYPQPLEFFKKTEENRRERPLSNKEMSKMMTEHRSKSFTTYFPKDVFSKYCPSDVAVASSNYFSELAPRKSSSLLGCRNCCDSVLHPDHNKPCWFLKREITLHIFAWVSMTSQSNTLGAHYRIKNAAKRKRTILELMFAEIKVLIILSKGSPQKEVTLCSN